MGNKEISVLFVTYEVKCQYGGNPLRNEGFTVNVCEMGRFDKRLGRNTYATDVLTTCGCSKEAHNCSKTNHTVFSFNILSPQSCAVIHDELENTERHSIHCHRVARGTCGTV